MRAKTTNNRLSNRQIATLRHLAICCGNGGQVTLTRDQRECLVPLWRREIVEMWYRHIPGERSRGQLRGPASEEEAPILATARRNIKAALELIEHRLAIHKETVS